MNNVTSSSALFRQRAEDLVKRLEPYDGDLVRAMVREAESLISILRTWELRRPDDATRVAIIQQLFDLNRRAMDFISRSGSARR